MLKVRNIQKLSLGCRVMSSAATSNEPVAANYDQARPYKEVPKIPFLSMAWDSIKDPLLKFDKWMDGFFTTHGPVLRIWTPGQGDRVFIKDPRDIQMLLNKDGQYPINLNPGVDFFVYYR